MSLSLRSSKNFSKPRGQGRLPMELGVRISGGNDQPGTEHTFTENVSAGGARVVTSRPWKLNDRLNFATLTGSFSAAARVAYCHAVPAKGFAIGLEFLGAPQGQWVVSPA